MLQVAELNHKFILSDNRLFLPYNRIILFGTHLDANQPKSWYLPTVILIQAEKNLRLPYNGSYIDQLGIMVCQCN